MTTFRAFRNDDLPALASLWNRGSPGDAVAAPLDPGEFEARVAGHLGFEAQGLIVAERDGRPIGFAHGGFGPSDPSGATHRLDRSLGTVCMLMADPEVDDEQLDADLFGRAVAYLRRRGAAVVYAGGRDPVNPFYWGLYGGSEFSGILRGHRRFRRAAERLGFAPCARTVLCEYDLATRPLPRDPRSILLGRRHRLEICEDAMLPRWWSALAIGPERPTSFRMVDRSGSPMASAFTWEMAGFERRDGRSRVGLVDVEVTLEHRRKGLGRHFIGEVLRFHRERGDQILCVQTDEANVAAEKLYRTFGFTRTDEATLYRAPA